MIVTIFICTTASVRPSAKISLRWSFIYRNTSRRLSIDNDASFSIASKADHASHRIAGSDCTSNAHKVKEIPRANLKRLAMRCRGTHAIRFRLLGRGQSRAREDAKNVY